MPVIETACGEIHYLERGAPTLPPIVLVHGAGGDAAMWDPVLDRFPGWRVLALDLPGHGRSDGEGQSRVEPYSEAVEAFCQALGLPAAVIVGHSLGGAVAQMLARGPSPACRAAVLSCTFPHLPADPARLQQIENAWEDYLAFNAPLQVSDEASARLHRDAEAMVRRREPSTFLNDLRACDAFQSEPWLQEVSVPVLVLSAQEDELTPLSGALRLYQGVPRARLAVLGPGRHWLMAEQPRQYAACVAAFAEEVTTSGD